MNDVKQYVGFGYAKTLIFGEYAVLHGAPGLVMALPRKLHLRLELTPNIERPSHSFARILQEKLTQFFGLSGNIELDDSAFFDRNDVKYGIGSSAAGVVALCRAATRALNREFSLPQAIRIHRDIQHGLGSGIDIHASALGGILSVQNCPDAPQYRSILPDHLPHIAVLAAHHSSTTTDYLSAARKVENTREYRHAIEALSDCYRQLTQCAENGDKSSFCQIISQIPSILKDFEIIIDRPILPPCFDVLSELAREHGVILKTSGAGGGDILLAISMESQNIESYLEHIPGDIPLTLLNLIPHA